MSHSIYKLIHFTGIFMLLLGLGGQITLGLLGNLEPKAKRFLSMFHGIGLLITLVAGFGLLAKLQIGFPLWVIAKLVIWTLLGGISAVALRKPHLAKPVVLIVTILATCAAYLAINKPF